MKYSEIKYRDHANGTGLRTSLFVSGCNRHCPGCFNQETWDFNHGNDFTESIKEDLIRSLAPDYISGISILGGEPFEWNNQIELLFFLQDVKFFYPKKTIWIFTGFNYEELLSKARYSIITYGLLHMIDVLKDGSYVKEKHISGNHFFGSSNQRLIDVPASLRTDNTVLWDSYPERRIVC